MFYEKIRPGREWHYSDDPAKSLIVAAFHLYAAEWGPGYDVRNWAWPLDWLQSGHEFTGDEPWTVLLRRAVELSRVAV